MNIKLKCSSLDIKQQSINLLNYVPTVWRFFVFHSSTHYVLFKIIRYSWVLCRFTPLFQYFHETSHILKCVILCTTAKK